MGELKRLEWIAPETLQDNPRNWRRHPAPQKRALRKLVERVGWAGALLYNERTGRLVDGHLRRDLAVQAGVSSVPVLVGDWSEEEEKIILASLDPIAMMAQQDKDSFLALLDEIDAQNRAILNEVKAYIIPDTGDVYQQSISVPGYDEAGAQVTTEELVDRTLYDDLMIRIGEAAGISQHERDFLLLAATRFLLFDYSKIARYYVSASQEMRKLMERCGLVIVDIDQAIESGLTHLIKALRDRYRDEYRNDASSDSVREN
jgi:hypothetical protein